MTTRLIPIARWSVIVLGTGLVVFAGRAEAACVLRSKPLKPELLDSFEKAPKQILLAYPRGGWGLENLVAQLSARKAANVGLILSSAVGAKGDQQTSLGRGLRTAAESCQAQDPNVAKAAAAGVVKAGQPALTRAYNLAGGDGAAPVSLPGRARSGAAPELPPDVSATPAESDPFGPLTDPFGPPSVWH